MTTRHQHADHPRVDGRPISITASDAAAALLEASKTSSETGRRDKLVLTIESEIIPRLMMMHGECRHGNDGTQPTIPAAPRADDGGGACFGEGAVTAFSDMLVDSDLATACRHVNGLLRLGLTWDDLLLRLMQPAARHLGEDWLADRRDFTEVTLGLGMLQRVLRESNPANARPPRPVEGGRRILLVATPGEQHTFGVLMVEDFFRRAGWDVHVEADTTMAGVANAVRRDWYCVIGFSLGSESLMDQLTSAIGSVRKASRNPDIGVLVGGPAFVERPDLARSTGADGVAFDGVSALNEADRITKAFLAAD